MSRQLLSFSPAFLRRRGNILTSALGYYVPANGVTGRGSLTNEVNGYTTDAQVHVAGNSANAANVIKAFVTSNATITYDYGDGPETGQRSMLVTSTGTNGNVYVNLFNTPAGDYTIAFEAKAATPVTVRTGKGATTYIDVTSEWQTFTIPANQASLGIMQVYWLYRDTVDYAVEIANMRVHPGTVDLGADGATDFPLYFSMYKTNAVVPTLPANSWDNVSAFVPFGEKRTFTAHSGALEIKSGTSPGSGSLVEVDSLTTKFAIRHSVDRILSFGFTGFTTEGYAKYPGFVAGETAVVTWSADTSSIAMCRNKLPVVVLGYGPPSFDAGHFLFPTSLMGTDFGGGVVALYDTALSASQLAALDTKVVALSGGTVTEPDIGYYCCGDSITAGAVADFSFNSYADLVFQNTSGLTGSNVAFPGETLSWQEQKIDLYIPYWQAAISAGRTVVVSLMIGRNDSTSLIADWSAYYDDVKAVAAKIKATGATLIMCDILPCSIANFNTARGNFNAQLATDEGTWFDVHADFSGVAAGQDGAESNATYYSDGTHPTQAGHDNLYPVMQAAYDAAIA